MTDDSCRSAKPTAETESRLRYSGVATEVFDLSSCSAQVVMKDVNTPYGVHSPYQTTSSNSLSDEEDTSRSNRLLWTPVSAFPPTRPVCAFESASTHPVLPPDSRKPTVPHVHTSSIQAPRTPSPSTLSVGCWRQLRGFDPPKTPLFGEEVFGRRTCFTRVRQRSATRRGPSQTTVPEPTTSNESLAACPRSSEDTFGIRNVRSNAADRFRSTTLHAEECGKRPPFEGAGNVTCSRHRKSSGSALRVHRRRCCHRQR